MSSKTGVHHFCTLDELLAARRALKSKETISATDARCCAPTSFGDMWVSTPNMWFIPQLPIHKPKEVFGYFDDGMLGIHEWLKWPQPFYSPEPHCMAAPMDPNLLSMSQESDAFEDGHCLPPPEKPLYGGRFNDLNVTWDPISKLKDFDAVSGVGDIGMLKRSVLLRLAEAKREAQELAEEIAVQTCEEEVNPEKFAHATETYKKMTLNRYLFHRSKLAKLQQTFNVLQQHTASYFEILMYYREFQRLLLDVRGWIYWMSEIRPRVLDPDFCRPFPVLPVRGVITSDPLLVQTFFRVGIPVWYVRKLHTFTSHTWINQVRTELAPIGYSHKRIISGTSCSTIAPSWKDGPDMAWLAPDELHERARRFSILNRPMLHDVREYELDSVADGVISAARTTDSGHVRNQSADVAVSAAKLPNEDEVISRFRCGQPFDFRTIQHNTTANLDRAIESLASQMSQMCVRGVPDSIPRNQTGKALAISAQRPSWARQTEAISFVEQALVVFTKTHTSRRVTYHLPPPHLFYCIGRTNGIKMKKIHNWLRIRRWCFDQVSQSQGGQVVMSPHKWRFALEGTYFLVEDDNVRQVLRDHPHLEAHAARLPFRPQDTKRRRVMTSKDQTDYRGPRQDRLPDRIAVAVRFGIDGGFAPYTGEETVTWGNMRLDADMIERDQDTLVHEIAWELSVANFRLEFLELDRCIMQSIYTHADQALAAHREYLIRNIWDNGFFYPEWTVSLDCDPLSLGTWTDRVVAVRQMALVMAVWPGGSRFKIFDPNVIDSAYLFHRFEREVFWFYGFMFHYWKGRRPIFPMLQPRSMTRHHS